MPFIGGRLSKEVGRLVVGKPLPVNEVGASVISEIGALLGQFPPKHVVGTPDPSLNGPTYIALVNHHRDGSKTLHS
jgi:hypothetical protein